VILLFNYDSHHSVDALHNAILPNELLIKKLTKLHRFDSPISGTTQTKMFNLFFYNSLIG
jgi:hypothetical protein